MKKFINGVTVILAVFVIAVACSLATAESFERTVRRDSNRNAPMIIEESPSMARPGMPVVIQEPGTTAVVEEGRDMSMVLDEPEDAVGAEQITNPNNNW